MPGTLAPIYRWTVLQDGKPAAGARLYSWLSGTNTPSPLYNSVDLAPAHAHTNPVIADSTGTFPVLYIDAINYRFMVTAADGTTIFPAQDDINGATGMISVISVLGNYTITPNDGGEVLILADATAGNLSIALYSAIGYTGRKIRVIKTDATNNVVVINPFGGQLINGAIGWNIQAQYDGISFVSNGLNWVRFSIASVLQEGINTGTSITLLPTMGDDLVVQAAAFTAPVNVTLYPILGNLGRRVTLKRNDTNPFSLALVAAAGELIDDQPYVVLPAYADWVTVVASNNGWLVESSSKPYDVTNITIGIAGNTITLDLSINRVFTFIMDADITTTVIQNVLESHRRTFFEVRTVGDGTARAWPFFSGTVKWTNGVVPTITSTSGKHDWYRFMTVDQGSLWYGQVIGQNFTS
jgi:hypothetical protein